MKSSPVTKIPNNRKFLCFNQVGINPIKLTGIMAMIRAISTVSPTKADSVGNNNIMKGIARQCSRQTDDKVILSRERSDLFEDTELCKTFDFTGMKDKFHEV